MEKFFDIFYTISVPENAILHIGGHKLLKRGYSHGGKRGNSLLAERQKEKIQSEKRFALFMPQDSELFSDRPARHPRADIDEFRADAVIESPA